MKNKLVVNILLILSLLVTSKSYSQDLKAQEIINKAIKVMGGTDALQSVESIKKDGRGHTYLIEQSQRPTGPFFVFYTKFSTLIMPQAGKAQQTSFVPVQGTRVAGFKFNIDKNTAGLITGNNFRAFREATDEELYLSPEYILTIAKEAGPIYLKDTVISSVNYHIISFKWQQYPVRILFNSLSGFPAFVEIIRHYVDDTPFVMGDVKKIYQYSFWKRVDKKISYPFQRDVYIDGVHWQSSTLDSVKLNIPLAPDSLSIPDSARVKLLAGYKVNNPFNPVKLESKEVYPGIHFISGKSGQLGAYNCTFINTAKGIVVLEAPVTSAYSKSVINEIEKIYPGKKINAVISTSDAWPHVGGIREYIAGKIPVYALNLNEALIRRVANANYITYPDSLQITKAKPVFKTVTGKTIIGQGDDRIELYPIKTEAGERMIMVYFPKYKLLYSSDLVQSVKTLSPLLQQYLSELKEAVIREKLNVEFIFGMHVAPVKYQEVLSLLLN